MDDIVRFLADQAPWRSLPFESLASAVSDIQIEFFPRGAPLSSSRGIPLPFLVIVRTGAVEARGTLSQPARLLGRFAEGDLVHGIRTSDDVPFDLVAVEDTLAYLMPEGSFDRLLSHDSFARFFRLGGEGALVSGEQGQLPDAAERLLRELPLRPALVDSPDATIGEVALRMRENDEGCAVITGRPLGLLTDRILRNEVVAGGISPEAPVSAIMQPVPCLSPDTTVLQAITSMMEHETAFLPILEGERVVALLARADLVQAQVPSPLLLGRALKGTGRDCLTHYGRQLRATATQLLRSGFSPSALGRVMAQAHDNLVRELIREARTTLGAAPGAFCWLALGRLGRKEPWLWAIQEHALAYEDGLCAADGAWFSSLASHVRTGLEQAGFGTSTREILATNPLWCRPASAWRSYFADWAVHPDRQVAAQAAPFFDARAVAGELDADAEILPALLEAGANSAFRARLTRNLLVGEQPPIGFFRNGVLEADGTLLDQLDVTSRVLTPIVAVARLVALEARLGASTTQERLEKAGLSSFLDPSMAGELAMAHRWVSRFRLERQVGSGQAETDGGVVMPSELDPEVRAPLTRCFRILARVLDALRAQTADRGGPT